MVLRHSGWRSILIWVPPDLHLQCDRHHKNDSSVSLFRWVSHTIMTQNLRAQPHKKQADQQTYLDYSTMFVALFYIILPKWSFAEAGTRTTSPVNGSAFVWHIGHWAGIAKRHHPPDIKPQKDTWIHLLIAVPVSHIIQRWSGLGWKCYKNRSVS